MKNHISLKNKPFAGLAGKVILISLLIASLAGCNFPGKTVAPATTEAAVSEAAAATQALAEPTAAPEQEQPTEAAPAVTEAVAEPTAETAAAPEVALTVIKPDGGAVTFTIANLKQLPQQENKLSGKRYKGPSLAEIIRAAGVASFTQVTVTGANNALTLTQAQLNDKIFLDFSSKGSLKLIQANLAQDQWLKGVTQIKVE